MTRILLVEDSPTQALPIKQKLEHELYEVALAENGEVALSLIPTFEPDLILTDLQMPVMNGLELVAASLATYPPVPAILITAKGSDELAIEALERGAAAYLPKSQLEDKLLSTISQVLSVMKADHSYSELIRSMDYNELRFTLSNNAALISPLVDLMQRMASGMGLCDDVGRVRLGMALEHALQNALYHGNLELRTDQLEGDDEFDVTGEQSVIEKRCEESPYSDRKIYVTVKLTPDEAAFTVRDEGRGFDTSKLPARHDPQMLDENEGRGLVLIRSFMDEVNFQRSRQRNQNGQTSRAALADMWFDRSLLNIANSCS